MDDHDRSPFRTLYCFSHLFQGPQLVTQIQMLQWLIQQQQPWLLCPQLGQSRPLAFAAGKRAKGLRSNRGQLERCDCIRRSLFILGTGS